MNPIKSFRKSFKIKFLIVTRNGINGFIVCIEGTFPYYHQIDPNSFIGYPTLNCTLFASGTPFIYYRGVWRKCRATSNRQIDSITIKPNRFKCILYVIAYSQSRVGIYFNIFSHFNNISMLFCQRCFQWKNNLPINNCGRFF